MDELSESYRWHQNILMYHKYKLVNMLIRILNETDSKMNILHAAIMLLDAYILRRKKITVDKYFLLGHACLSLSNQLIFSSVDIDYYILKSLEVYAQINSTEKILISYMNKIVFKLQLKLICENPYTKLKKYLIEKGDKLEQREILAMKYVVTCLLYDVNITLYDPNKIIESVIYFTNIWMLECETSDIKYVESYLVENDPGDEISEYVKYICNLFCTLNTLSFVAKINKNPKFFDILPIIEYAPIVDVRVKKIRVGVKKQVETKIILSDYIDISVLCKGTYGKIFTTKHVPTDQTVVIKQQHFAINAVTEIAILKFLDHPHIIKLNDIHIIKYKTINMIMPYYRNDLHTVINRKNMLEKYVIKYTSQLLKTLKYCHEMGIIHQDIKPENILVSDDFKKIILIDFGISNAYSYGSIKLQSQVCTIAYRPPEILLQCEKYDNKVDMWSLGCVIAEMLTGQQVFYQSQNDNYEQLKAIFKKLTLPSEETWPDITNATGWCFDDASMFPKNRYLNVYVSDAKLKRVLDGLLTSNPNNRFNATDCLCIMDEKKLQYRTTIKICDV